MQDFGENYRGNKLFASCKLCGLHRDHQKLSFSCNEIKGHVKIRGNYEDIFEDYITKEVSQTIYDITQYRAKLNHK